MPSSPGQQPAEQEAVGKIVSGLNTTLSAFTAMIPFLTAPAAARVAFKASRRLADSAGGAASLSGTMASCCHALFLLVYAMKDNKAERRSTSEAVKFWYPAFLRIIAFIAIFAFVWNSRAAAGRFGESADRILAFVGCMTASLFPLLPRHDYGRVIEEEFIQPLAKGMVARKSPWCRMFCVSLNNPEQHQALAVDDRQVPENAP